MGTANSQTTILGGWTFDGNKAVIVPANLGVNAASANLYANGTNGSSAWTLSSELDQFGGINTNDPRTPPDASNTLSAVNPSGNTNGKAWVLKLPTTGYQDINLSYATRGTAAGFTTQTWAYSTNGTSFTNIATITGRNVKSWSLQTVDLSGVAALNNATNIYLKVTFTGASGNGGNNRLDNILVKGNELAVAPVVTGGSTTGTVGQSFSYTVSATGSPTSFSSTGTIPPGLTFNTTTGAITGTPTTAGSYTLSVTASNTHGTSPAADVNITINKANQSITFSGPTSATYGDAPVTLTGSSSSSLPVTYVSDNPSVATISGNTLTIVGAGSTFITASQSGNANYNAAADVTIELVVAKADQTITFNALPDKTTDDPDFALTASSTSGLPISYSSSNTAVINISGTTAEIVGAGNSLITASQPGNANYNPATPVDQNQYVSNAALADQTITFPSIPAAVYGDAPVTLNASASSGLTVNYTSSDPSVALVSGNTLIIVGVGTTTITAKQPGNGSYNPAPAEMQDFTVSAKALTISGIVVNNKTYDGTTTASVDLSGASLVGVVGSDDVSFNGTAEFADPNAATGVAIVTNYVLSGADATKYILSQPVLSADIFKADQTISFDPISDKNTNDLPFTLNATSTSGLAVTFESSNPSVATVSGNTVSIVGPGSVTITASQDGDLNYNAATDVQQSFNVTLAPTIVKWNFGTSSANPAPSSGVPVNNLNISNFSAGNNANTSQTGLQLNTSSGSNNTGASGQYNASITAENESFNAATSAYFEFTLTPAAGFTVTLNSLSFGSRSTSTGPTDLEIRTSADNFGSAAASFSQTPNSTWRGFSSNFSGITSSQPLVVRIYGFVQDGSGSVNSSSANNFRIDDVTIDLLVAVMPECSGTPDAGTASAQTSAFCVAGSTDITLTGYTDPLTNQGISIQWYSSTDNVTFTEVTGANAAVLNTGTITQTTYYYNTVTCAASGLSANSNTVEVTINPVPEATISGLTSFCSGNSTTLTASEGASYDWKYEGNSFATSRSVSVNQAGNYTVTVTSAAGCSATSATTVVTETPAPTAPVISGIVNVCPYLGTSEALTYTLIPVPGATSYNWTVSPAATIVSGQGTTSITVVFGSTYGAYANKQIRATAVTPCGEGPVGVFYTAAQFPVTPRPITGPTDVCPYFNNSLEATYSIEPVIAATSYAWNVPAGATITENNGTSIKVTFGPSFVTSAITVTAVNGCGVSGTRSLTVNRSLPSTPGLISGPTNTCLLMPSAGLPQGENGIYAVTRSAANIVYNWTVPAGAEIVNHTSTETQDIIEVKFTSAYNSGNISVVAETNCGISQPRELKLSKLNPGAPGVITEERIGNCPERTFTYSLTSAPGGSNYIQWTVPTGGTIVSGQGTTSITVTYDNIGISGNVTVVGLNGCRASSTRILSVKVASCTEAPAGKTGNLDNIFVEESSNTIYPNPSTSSFSLKINGTVKGNVQVNIYDLTGRKHQSLRMNASETVSFGQNLKPGTYMVEVINGNSRKVSKIVKL